MSRKIRRVEAIRGVLGILVVTVPVRSGCPARGTVRGMAGRVVLARVGAVLPVAAPLGVADLARRAGVRRLPRRIRRCRRRRGLGSITMARRVRGSRRLVVQGRVLVVRLVTAGSARAARVVVSARVVRTVVVRQRRSVAVPAGSDRRVVVLRPSAVARSAAAVPRAGASARAAVAVRVAPRPVRAGRPARHRPAVPAVPRRVPPRQARLPRVAVGAARLVAGRR